MMPSKTLFIMFFQIKSVQLSSSISSGYIIHLNNRKWDTLDSPYNSSPRGL